MRARFPSFCTRTGKPANSGSPCIPWKKAADHISFIRRRAFGNSGNTTTVNSQLHPHAKRIGDRTSIANKPRRHYNSRPDFFWITAIQSGTPHRIEFDHRPPSTGDVALIATTVCGWYLTNSTLLDQTAIACQLSTMPTSTRNSSRKSVTGDKPRGGKNGSARRSVDSAKLSKKWRFAPDAIGMVDGPGDLSRRKGLSV